MEVDIYEDLDNYNLEEENRKVQSENEVLKSKLTELEKNFDDISKKYAELKTKNDELETNFSSLFKTAYAEVARKDRIINELREEKDKLVFKRNNNPTQSVAYNNNLPSDGNHNFNQNNPKKHDIEIPRAGTYVPLENFKHLSRKERNHNGETPDENKFKPINERTYHKTSSEYGRSEKDEYQPRNFDRKRPRSPNSPSRRSRKCYSPRNSPTSNSYNRTNDKRTAPLHSRSRSKENYSRNHKIRSKSPFNRNDDHRSNQYNNYYRNRPNFNKDPHKFSDRNDHKYNYKTDHRKSRQSPLNSFATVKNEPNVISQPVPQSDLFGDNSPVPPKSDHSETSNIKTGPHHRVEFSPYNESDFDNGIRSPDKIMPVYSDNFHEDGNGPHFSIVKTTDDVKQELTLNDTKIKKSINLKNDMEEGEVSSDDDLFVENSKKLKTLSNQTAYTKLTASELLNKNQQNKNKESKECKDKIENLESKALQESETKDIKPKYYIPKIVPCPSTEDSNEKRIIVKHQRKIKSSFSSEPKNKYPVDESSNKTIEDVIIPKTSSRLKESTTRNDSTKHKDSSYLFTDTKKYKKPSTGTDHSISEEKHKNVETDASSNTCLPEKKDCTDVVPSETQKIKSVSSEDNNTSGKDKIKTLKSPDSNTKEEDKFIDRLQSEKKHVTTSKDKSKRHSSKTSKTVSSISHETENIKNEETSKKKTEKTDKVNKLSSKSRSIEKKVDTEELTKTTGSGPLKSQPSDPIKISTKAEKSNRKDEKPHHLGSTKQTDATISIIPAIKNEDIIKKSLDNSTQNETEKKTETDSESMNNSSKMNISTESLFTKSIIDTNTVNVKLHRKRNTLIKK